MHVNTANSLGGVVFMFTAIAAALPTTLVQSESAIAPIRNVELGPRPQYLVNAMAAGALKSQLSSCLATEAHTSRFSIGHRGGAALQFPEETLESLEAGLRMGAGILECDVAFTADRRLVCRHDQCDLHRTTNIVATDLGKKCSRPFRPAGNGTEASATCCTSDLTLDEFRALCPKMDGFNASAATPEEYLHGTPAWRTDLYAAACGTLLSHKDFIAAVERLGGGKLDFTAELKAPRVPMPFQGNYTREAYAQQLVDEYREAGIDPGRVWLQSFAFEDVEYWLKKAPEFGRQAILLDESADPPEGTLEGALGRLEGYRDAGVQIIGPPLPYLVTLDASNEYVPSNYATKAKELGLDIITWSLERSGPLANVARDGDYYYTSIANGTHGDGDMYKLVDVLARQVGVKGMFSDWAATVTLYANCFGLEGP
ncbi:glycerophosphoryl diester phosphodiesterase family protein [Xylariomycetidae sp. FL0641]|nr:glycerophosphoryl diester phosphodiesterase family protein [Xylariomycetidae sp. FL0641]